MELLQSQVQHLSQQQLQSVELLQMSAAELEEYLHNLVQENPVVELDDSRPEPERPQDDELLRRLKWLDDNDRQNRYYQHVGEEELDPLARVGTEGGLEETLFRFISRQLYTMDLDEDTAQTVRYLAACLDGDGYFRVGVEELAANLGRPAAHWSRQGWGRKTCPSVWNFSCSVSMNAALHWRLCGIIWRRWPSGTTGPLPPNCPSLWRRFSRLNA